MSSWAPWPCMRIVWHSISVGPPPSRARSTALVGGGEDRLDVVAVDRDALEPVGPRPLDRVDGELELVRGRVGELVVLEHEDDRQLLHAGEVHRLVPLAVGGRALAEEGHRHPRLGAHLEGERQAGGDERHVGQHRDHADAAELAGRRSACCRPCRRSRRRCGPCSWPGSGPGSRRGRSGRRGRGAGCRPGPRARARRRRRRRSPPGRSRRRRSRAPCPACRASARAPRRAASSACSGAG